MVKNDICDSYYSVKDYQIFSDIGFIPIDYVIRTIPLKKYIIYFVSGNYIICADRHAFIDIEGDEIIASNLYNGCLICVDYNDGIDEVYDIINTNEYEKMYDVNLLKHHLYYTNDVLSHNSATMANFAAWQVLHGHNVLLLTMEMSEDAFAQRFDSIYTTLDINKIYTVNTETRKLLPALKAIKETPDRGHLWIKQFPTGEASTLDFKRYIRELKMRGIAPSIIYIDYINLVKPSTGAGEVMYSNVKKVAEEMRALSFSFECPIVTVSQLNREGSIVAFSEVDFVYIAECVSLDTVVMKKIKNSYRGVEIKDIKIGDYIKGYNKDVLVSKVFPIKKKKMIKIKTKKGKEIICSVDHKIFTDKGMISYNMGLRKGNNINIDERWLE